jgi:hypothetical protein
MDAPARLSVSQLNEYWDGVASLKGEETMRALHSRQMPPWEDICGQLNWRLHRLDQGYFSEKHHGFCGVYRLTAYENETDFFEPTTLNRLCAPDPTGTLYVGHASQLHTRLNQLRRSFDEYKYERSHGVPYALRALPWIRTIPVSRLGVAVLFTNRLTRMVERDLIRAYMNTYGDAPPLNYRL